LILFFFRDLLDRRRFWLWFAVSAPLVGAVFFVLDRDLGWYVGLSGLLQGLLVLCLVIGWRGNPVLHSLVLAVVAGRLVWEQLPGYDVDYLRAWINGRVYVNAHLYGALSGALLAVAMLLVAGRRRTTLGRRSDIC
ncbi:MAG TPA: rhombosortase, partial [Alcanivorax sp.]|nr:rhombosortase [Alcanivorax sp.]